MKINNDPVLYPYMLDPSLVHLLNALMENSDVDDSCGLVLNFRDPTYSPETGGYHPVEIAIDQNGKIQYLTDFAYFGMPPMVELGKELDFDFSQGVFQQFDRLYEISVSQGLFILYVRNFVAYHEMGVYEVTVSPL